MNMNNNIHLLKQQYTSILCMTSAVWIKTKITRDKHVLFESTLNYITRDKHVLFESTLNYITSDKHVLS